MRTGRHAVLVCVSLLLLPFASGAPASADLIAQASVGDSFVWSTRVNCRTPRLVNIRVLYKDTPVYRSSVSLCRVARGDLPLEASLRVRRFYFTGEQRDFAPTLTSRIRAIEGRIWEASTEAESVVLGLSLSTPEQVLLNTTHVTSPVQPSHNLIAPLLAVTTDPVETRKMRP